MLFNTYDTGLISDPDNFLIVSFSPGCCQQILISHRESANDVFEVWTDIFNIYKIENNTIHGKAHYITKGGTMEMWQGNCGFWMVGPPVYR